MLIQVFGVARLSFFAQWSIILFFSNLTIDSLQAKGGYFEFNAECKEIYQAVTSLQLEKAEYLILDQQKKEPDNLILEYLKNYIDFFVLFIGEEDYEFHKRKHQEAIRLKKISNGDRSSPYYWYCLAEINLQWALIRLKQEEYFSSYSEIRNAYRYLEKNQKLHPGFMPNLKSLGILHALLGTIPDRFKGLFSFFSGMRGTIQQGREEVEQVLEYSRNHDFIFKDETVIMYAFLLLHLKNEGEVAWQMLRKSSIQNQQSPLYSFAASSVAMHTGRNDEAIQLLENRVNPEGSFPFYYLDFVLGVAKLRRLDNDADGPLLTFVKRFKGRNYIKEAYQKLAWSALVNHQESDYYQYLKKCKKYGKAIIDEDKSALFEAQKNQRPRKELLESRLLFDGGYYTKALLVLQSASAQLPNFDGQDQLEFIYRKGRILQALQKFPEALQSYQYTVDQGSKNPNYYACKAALLSGNIYEKQGKLIEANKYYKTCLRINPQEFRTSLHQKAKAGLNRIN